MFSRKERKRKVPEKEKQRSQHGQWMHEKTPKPI
jgi:hypothetical protein